MLEDLLVQSLHIEIESFTCIHRIEGACITCIDKLVESVCIICLSMFICIWFQKMAYALYVNLWK
jgi:hypothetical protein